MGSFAVRWDRWAACDDKGKYSCAAFERQPEDDTFLLFGALAVVHGLQEVVAANGLGAAQVGDGAS